MTHKKVYNNNPNEAEPEDVVLLLRVQYRRNTSWQGTIQCFNTRESRIFRSVLELGSLIHDAKLKSGKKDNQTKPKMPIWSEKESVS